LQKTFRDVFAIQI